MLVYEGTRGLSSRVRWVFRRGFGREKNPVALKAGCQGQEGGDQKGGARAKGVEEGKGNSQAGETEGGDRSRGKCPGLGNPMRGGR